METKVLPCDEAGIAYAAEILRSGGVVAFPTETVYGLGANAHDDSALRAIFEAKRRPPDNPLIAHVLYNEQVEEYARQVPDRAKRLMEAFWPGPLTLVLEQKPGAFPAAMTAGLSTFAVRRPAHPAAIRLLRASGMPIAAPSANSSGRPSPTCAAHVLEDMQGRIPLILDGGPCDIGLESTVVSVTDRGVTLLRPGGVTAEMIRGALGGEEASIARGVDEPMREGDIARSPGMMHRHYAPDARVAVVRDGVYMRALYDAELANGGRPVVLTSDASALEMVKGISLGEHPERRLFSALREADKMGATLILFMEVPKEGIGHAIMNRALRAAGLL